MRYFWSNKATTIPGIIAGLANVLPLFGVPVPPGIVDGVTIVMVVLIGLFSKAQNVTGGSVRQ